MQGRSVGTTRAVLWAAIGTLAFVAMHGRAFAHGWDRDWRHGHSHGSTSTSSGSSTSGGVQVCHTINFDADSNGAPVVAGDVLSDEWRSLGLTVECEERGWFHHHG